MKFQKVLLRRLFLLTAIVAVGITLQCCADSEKYTPEHISVVVWGTVYHVTFNPEGVENTFEVTSAVTESLNEVDSAANLFNPKSELSVFNSTGFLNSPSGHFRTIFTKSAKLNRETDGAFDPTVGALVRLWGFGDDTGENAPDSVQIANAMATVGFANIETDSAGVFTQVPGLTLDFGAIAKGYAVDWVANALSAMNITDFMVEIGGEVRVSGNNPSGGEWIIQIDEPLPDTTGSHRRLMVIEVKDAAVATSGNYRNFRYDDEGRLVHHTISPVTGRPATSDILSATIIAADCLTADALATASMVMGLQKASAMIERLCANPETEVFGAIFVTSGYDAGSPYQVHIVEGDSQRFKGS